MKIKTLFSALIFSGCALPSLAQFSVSGKVRDTNAQALPFAYVLLQKDTTTLQTAQTDEQGVFKINDIKTGDHNLSVRLLGYTTIDTPISISESIEIGAIVLSLSGEKLKDVVISDRKNTITTGAGKTIVEIREEQKQGNNLLDLLKSMPGLTVSGDGTVSMDGKQGIVVLVNDKPTYMEGKELTEYMKGISAVEVTHVELMTQPSAKYDAAGNAGIINIKLDPRKSEGWSGNVTAAYDQGLYPYRSLNTGLNYKKNRAVYTFNPVYYEGQGYLEYDRETTIKQNGTPVKTLKEYSFRHETFPDYSLRTGVDYELSDKTSMAISAKGTYHTNEETDKNSLVITDVATGTNVYNNTRNDNGHKRYHIDVNSFALHKFDSAQQLEYNGGVFITNRDLYQRLTSNNYGNDSTPTAPTYLLNNSMPDKTNLYFAKLDYILRGSNDKMLEAGIKSSYTTMDEANIFTEFINDAWIDDTNRSNRFLYNENINAVYASGSIKKERISIQGGLRVEHTLAHGNQVTQQKEFTQNYTSLFPTVFITYNANENNTLELNYNKRIQRPFYRELNPFTRFTTPFSYNIGNPQLRPMFTHNIEVKHNYKGRFITVASFSKTLGVFTEILQFEPATNTTISSTINAGSSSSGDLTVFYNSQVTKWLNLNAKALFSYMTFERTTGNSTQRASGTAHNLSLNAQFFFDKGWSGQVFNVYQGAGRAGITQTYAANLWLSANVSKSLFKDTTTIRLSVNDPFHIYRYTDTVTVGEVSTSTERAFNTQAVSLALSYNFGKRDEARNRTQSPEEAGRM